MKKFIALCLAELVLVSIGSVIMFFVWNYMAANYFHWKDIDFIQAVMITATSRILTISIN